MSKVYAVKSGRIPGKYNTWEECEKQVKGFKGAEFKSFSGESADIEASYYLGILDKSSVIFKPANKKDSEQFFERIIPLENNTYDCGDSDCVAFVDGSWDKNTEKFGSGVVLFTNNTKYIVHACDDEEYLRGMHNVAGELMAAILAVKLAKFLGKTKITIIHDLEGTAKWVRYDSPYKKHWDRNKRGTFEYGEFMDNQMITIDFKWVKGHTGVEHNEEADALAASAIKTDVRIKSKDLFSDENHVVDFIK